jgi:hypothetical protein
MDFVSWKKRELHKNAFFIADGIINKELWDKAPIKVLFILKEAYESDKDETKEWVLNDYLDRDLDKLGKIIWWSIAQWLHGINQLIKTGDVEPFDEKFKDISGIDDTFRSCAVINLKKSSGLSSSSTEDLAEYVKSDWDLLWQQVEEIKPDLIICGATYPLIASQLDTPVRSAEWLYLAKGYHFVDFWHPSNQWPYKVKYYSLLSALKQSMHLWSPLDRKGTHINIS